VLGRASTGATLRLTPILGPARFEWDNRSLSHIYPYHGVCLGKSGVITGKRGDNKRDDRYLLKRGFLSEPGQSVQNNGRVHCPP
jgi:hypothetical protein